MFLSPSWRITRNADPAQLQHRWHDVTSPNPAEPPDEWHDDRHGGAQHGLPHGAGGHGPGGYGGQPRHETTAAAAAHDDGDGAGSDGDGNGGGDGRRYGHEPDGNDGAAVPHLRCQVSPSLLPPPPPTSQKTLTASVPKTSIPFVHRRAIPILNRML